MRPGVATATAAVHDHDGGATEPGRHTRPQCCSRADRLGGVGHALGECPPVAAGEPTDPLQARHPHAGGGNCSRHGFEAGIGYRKAIYTPFPQAVPKYPVLTPEDCTYFQKGTCKACEKFCPVDCIDFTQTDEFVEVRGPSDAPLSI